MDIRAPRSDREILLADKVPARVLAAGLGLIIGGPGGAIAGAAASPVFEYVMTKGNARYVEGANMVLVEAIAATDHSEEDIQDYLADSDARMAIAVGTVRAALDTIDRRKLRALTRVLAFGLTDDANLDVSALYIRAIRELESYHVQLLADLAHITADTPDGQFAGASTEQLQTDNARFGAGLNPILATLQREGLIGEDLHGGDDLGEVVGGFTITPFGLEVLAWLGDVDQEWSAESESAVGPS